jgi:hypothetical protein
MLKIISPITGEHLRIAESDLEIEMEWLDANKACNELHNGWRLPTKSEFEIIYKEIHKSGNGNFKNAQYWTKTMGFVFSIEGGCAFSISNLESKKHVRAVQPLYG